MEAFNPPQTCLESASESLDKPFTLSGASSATSRHGLLKQQSSCSSPLLRAASDRVKSYNSCLLHALKLPQQSNLLQAQVLCSEAKESQLTLPPATSDTRYRQSGGEVYKSARAPICPSSTSGSSLSDPNFLELIRSSASSGEEFNLKGDQSPTLSDSSASTIREIQPKPSLFDTYAGSAQILLINRFSMDWAHEAAIRSFGTPPPDAAKCGLLSTFKRIGHEEDSVLKPGQKNSDQKMWDDGFDAAIFMLSIRVDVTDRKHIRALTPYKLRGTQKAAQEYSSGTTTYLRRKLAWATIYDAFNQDSVNEHSSRDIELVAADFFSGRPVEAEYRNDNMLYSTEPLPYTLSFGTSDRARILEEDPLANNMLALFLLDLVMANDLEKACVTKEKYLGSLKVYRQSWYHDTVIRLQKAPKRQDIYNIFHLTKDGEETAEERVTLDEALQALCENGNLADGEIHVFNLRSGQISQEYLKPSGNSNGVQNASGTGEQNEVANTVAAILATMSANVDKTMGDNSQPLTPGQSSSAEGAATIFSEVGGNLSESPVTDDTASILELSASPVRSVASSPEAAEEFESLPKAEKVRDQVEARVPTTSLADKGEAIMPEATSSTPAVSSGSSKKKRSAKRKSKKKGQAANKNEGPVSSQDIEDATHASISVTSSTGKAASLSSADEIDPSVSISKDEPVKTGSQHVFTPADDQGWREVKTKVKSESSKHDVGHSPLHGSHTASTPLEQAETVELRKFSPEEYPALSPMPQAQQSGKPKGKNMHTTARIDVALPAISSKTPASESANEKAEKELSTPNNSTEVPSIALSSSAPQLAVEKGNNCLIPANDAANTPAVLDYSWEEDVHNPSPDEAEATRAVFRESQHSLTSPDSHLVGDAYFSFADVSRGTMPDTDSTTAADQVLGEKITETLAAQSTGLEWAAAELTSPTKFNSGWRHSSLTFQSTTSSHNDLEDFFETTTSRHRSNTTTTINPRVRAVQFGDLPVNLPESYEDESAAESAYPSSPSYSNPLSARHEQGFDPSADTGSAGNLPSSAGYSYQTPVPAHMSGSQSQYPPMMVMPQIHSTQGFLPPAPGYHFGHPNAYAIPYGQPTSGFSYPPQHVSAFHFGPVAHHGHPAPYAYQYSSNNNDGSSYAISYYDHPIDEGMHEESTASPSRTGSKDASIEISSNRDRLSPQGPPPSVGYTCSCCLKGAVASESRPLYFCPGCGPPCAIRYCSAACLLADSYSHSLHCMQYPYYMRMDPHDLPGDIYEWERWYLAPIENRTEQETPERYRQRSFAMYCYNQRPRPQVLKAWAIQHETPVGMTGFDTDEHFKRSGDYHIFRSEVTAEGMNFSPVEVLCTIWLRNGDPMKEALTRTLNACLIYLDQRAVKFLFRLIRHLLEDLDFWDTMMPILDQRAIYAEFIHQFSREFNFNAQAHANEVDDFDFMKEWKVHRVVMTDLEMQFQVLRCWYRTNTQFITPPLEPRN